MPYSTEIGRTNPSCFLFLIDQSGSSTSAPASISRTCGDPYPAPLPRRPAPSGCPGDGDRLWLMTDALAQWFLQQHEVGQRPWETLDAVLTAGEPFDQLKKRFTKTEAENILRLLHSFPAAELSRPETFETLIDYLTSNNLVVRELAAGHLYHLVPAVRPALQNYNAMAAPEARQQVQEACRKIIPKGKLPRPGTGGK
jgi:hypothetical protein